MSLRIEQIHARELAKWPDAILDIYEQRLDVLIVEDALDEGPCARAIERLERDAERLPWTPQEHPDPSREQMMVMGMTLTPVSGFELDHERYFRTAAEFRRAADALFDGAFEPRLMDLLRALSGGRPVRLPTDETGRAYTPATLRKLPVGFGIPVHCGNFFLETPGYRQLTTQIDLVDQLSYFFTLDPGDHGGELEVYDLCWGSPDTPVIDDVFYDGPRIARERDGERLSPPRGALLLFDGGRLYHRVTAVEGSRPRYTIGGFVGFSIDHSEVLFWS